MKRLALAIVVTLAIFYIGGSWSKVSDNVVKRSNESKEQMAKRLVEECRVSEYKPTCYDEIIPELMKTISMEEAFEVTRIVQAMDRDYPYCHVLGHELASLETRKDPAKWKDVVARCPAGVCSNGCIHGAFQERFRVEKMSESELNLALAEIEGVCEPRDGWSPTGLGQGTCYHALGHLAMYMSGANINKSLEICDLAIQENSNGYDWKPLCWDGVFMQLFQPLEAEDFDLIKGQEQTVATIKQFCSKYNGQQRVSCWAESWPLDRQKILNPQGLVQHCGWLPKEDQFRCFNGLYYVAAVQFNLQTQALVDFCTKSNPSYKGMCFANFASRLIETDWGMVDESVDLCRQAETQGVGDRCFQELAFYASYNFPQGSAEQRNLCQKLPEKWLTGCMEGNILMSNEVPG